MTTANVDENDNAMTMEEEVNADEAAQRRARGIEWISSRKRFNARRAYGQGKPAGFIGTASEGAGTDENKHKRLMKKWYGLTPFEYDWVYPCPYRLLGEHEPELDEFGEYEGPRYTGFSDRDDQLCHCDSVRVYKHTPGFQLVWDHARGWNDKFGRPVITLEPYGFPKIEEVESFVAPLERIRIGFEGRSPYGASYVLFLIGPDNVDDPFTAWRR